MNADNPSEPSTPRTVRCDRCRAGHRKCDGRRPACGQCLGKDRECTYRLSSTSNTSITSLRISQACTVCRAKKRKCDRELPVCGPCVRRDLALQCEYLSSTPARRSLLADNPLIHPRSDGEDEARPRKHPRLSGSSFIRGRPASPCLEAEPNGINVGADESGPRIDETDAGRNESDTSSDDSDTSGDESETSEIESDSDMVRHDVKEVECDPSECRGDAVDIGSDSGEDESDFGEVRPDEVGSDVGETASDLGSSEDESDSGKAKRDDEEVERDSSEISRNAVGIENNSSEDESDAGEVRDDASEDESDSLSEVKQNGVEEKSPGGSDAPSDIEMEVEPATQDLEPRNYRNISAIPPSPTSFSTEIYNSRGSDEDISLLNNLKEAISQRTDTSKPGVCELAKAELRRLSMRMKANIGFLEVQPDSQDLVLPTREIADQHMALYLTREYVNLPIIHLPAFQPKYLELWQEKEPMDDKGVFQGIVNLMLALGCLPNFDTQEEASMYFARGQKLIRLGSLNGEDIPCVQAYILSAQYLLAIGDVDAAWKSIGNAIRTAQVLHLHLKSGSQHLEKRVDRELAKRLWHSAIMLERMIAVNSGMASIASPPFRAPLPIPLETEYVDVVFGGEPMSGPDRPSIVEFFTASCRLYERYDDIVSIQDELRITDGRSPRKTLEAFDPQKLLDADRLLCNWNAALPPFLQSHAPAHENTIALRQHNVLRVRYLHLRLLLWRPLLAILAADPEICKPNLINGLHKPEASRLDTPLIYTIAKESAIKCILCAQEIVRILARFERLDEKSNPVGPAPSWWDNIGYLYCCATAMLAARLCSSAYDEMPRNTVEDCWSKSVDLLIRYRKLTPLVIRCLTVLEKLSSTVMEIEDKDEIKKEANGDEQFVRRTRDMTWLEMLPVDVEN
ncbi:hypothetical protein DIZ76_013627 [Coccidioides immitis]|nr:hypothetical protein DIZ76_013627 [Coccidioides immitis]